MGTVKELKANLKAVIDAADWPEAPQRGYAQDALREYQPRFVRIRRAMEHLQSLALERLPSIEVNNITGICAELQRLITKAKTVTEKQETSPKDSADAIDAEMDKLDLKNIWIPFLQNESVEASHKDLLERVGAIRDQMNGVVSDAAKSIEQRQAEWNHALDKARQTTDENIEKVASRPEAT